MRKETEEALRALESEDAAVRLLAIDCLGEEGDSEVVGQALVRLLDDVSALVRTEAVYALSSLGQRLAVDPVRRCLRDEQSALVRASAAEALGDLGDQSAIPDLIGALTDEDGPVRGYAANSLGLLGGPELLAILEARLAVEPEFTVRTEIEGARARLRGHGAFAALLRMFDDIDLDLGGSMLNVWEDLLTRRPPPELHENKAAVVQAFTGAADRFPLLRGHAQALIARLEDDDGTA